MEVWLWVLVGSLAVLCIALLAKIWILQNAAKEIEAAFVDKLITDTNTLVDISTNDRAMRSLANSINVQLRRLYAERHRFRQGDMELKNAVTNISHDLRTPLTAIFGYLDLLETEEDKETAKRYLVIIKDRAELLEKLTRELFQYSVILTTQETMKKEPVVLNAVLEESIAAFYTVLSERGITPNISMPEKKVIRFLDYSALSRIFSNLLNNAIKYSDGDLDILLQETGEITFSNIAYGLDVVSVGKLFDRFYTLEAARNSTGLGLAITKSLTESMNGEVSVDYKNGRLNIHILFAADSSEKAYHRKNHIK